MTCSCIAVALGPPAELLDIRSGRSGDFAKVVLDRLSQSWLTSDIAIVLSCDHEKLETKLAEAAQLLQSQRHTESTPRSRLLRIVPVSIPDSCLKE